MSKKLVPPDGGWGWLIAMAYALSLFCTIPIMQAFGLLFKDICSSLGMSATDISVIISVNSAFGMGLGLINGPLLRHFGYRKVAIAGAICHTTGLTLSAGANSFAYLIFTYGILCSLGTGIMNSAFSLALNSYFSNKRGRAVGFAMVLSGLGPILIPQLISLLMSQYGARGTVAILGAMSLNALVGAFVLQPIAWHRKKVEEVSDLEGTAKTSGIEDKEGKIDTQFISTSCEDLGIIDRKRTMTMSSIDHDVDTGSIYGFENLIPRKKSTSYAPSGAGLGAAYRKNSSQFDPVQIPTTPTERKEPAYKWWSSGKSLDTINLGSSMKIFDESRIYRASRSRDYSGTDGSRDNERRQSEIQALVLKQIVQTVHEEEDGAEEDEEQKHPEKKIDGKKSRLHRLLHSIVVFFDFDLLGDPVYVNIMLGMSLAIFAEINFSLLTPFILSDMELKTEQIATVMSTLAISDLISRGIAPFIGEWLNQTARIMYLISLSLLVAGRTGLLFAEDFVSILMVGLALGAAKGVRSVYMTLVIANYVPINKLASASGIQMVTNGIILICIGPILGLVKDNTGSYDMCIIFINGVTILTILMWTIEIIVRKSMAKSSKPIENVSEDTQVIKNN